ncbi:zinc-binding dehydrogenase [Streptomyces sp. NPDC048420]|uniref:zinc-binding dehydrogenase n=1 Tax=Streptomyces sp. NPDC048420 TaxID=3155755 RepID=UPI0034415D62
MTITCQAAVLPAPGQPLEIRDIQLTEPQPGEVLVRTAAAGICGTDLHFALGAFPYPTPTVLGHEASGTVAAVGAGVTTVAPGDRVIVCDQTFCGQCAACLSGAMVYCTDPSAKQRQHQRMRLGGKPIRQYLGVSAFAELMVVDAHALVPLPGGISFEAAALLSCCLTTGLATVFNVNRPAPGSTVAVIGTGGVGLGAIQGARIAGASRIIAVDEHQHRLAIAQELGATDTVLASVATAADIKELTGIGVDHAIEAVGSIDTAEQAFHCLAPGGRATIIGMVPADTDISVPGRLLRAGRSLSGTVMGSVRTQADIPRYADMLLRGVLHAEPLITSTRPLKGINDALGDAAERAGVRALIRF